MKKTAFTFLVILSLISCGRESSPEGRFQIRFEAMDQKLDSIKNQNSAILASINLINRELEMLKQERKAKLAE